MNYFRVCLIAGFITLLGIFLFFAYLNNSVLNNLDVEHVPIPSLNSDQIELYEKVFKEFANETPRLNRSYIKDIYESNAGDIIVHIGYFSADYVLVYANAKIIKGYAIRDQPMLPCYYVFDKDGRLIRKEKTMKGE